MEEVGSSWPVEAELGCKAGGAAREGTFRSHSCMEVEDLSSRKRNKQSLAGRSKAFSSPIITNFTCPHFTRSLMGQFYPLVVKPRNCTLWRKGL